MGLLSEANRRAAEAEEQARDVVHQARTMAVTSVAASQLDADARVGHANQQLSDVIVTAQHQHLQAVNEVATIRQQSQAQVSNASAAVEQVKAAAANEVASVKQHAEKVFQAKTSEIVSEAKQVINAERATAAQQSQAALNYQQQCEAQARQISELQTMISSMNANMTSLQNNAGQMTHKMGVQEDLISRLQQTSLSGAVACDPRTAASTASFGHNGTDLKERTQDVTFSTVPAMSADPSSAEQNERRQMIGMIDGTTQRFKMNTKVALQPKRSKSQSRYDRVQMIPPRSSSVARPAVSPQHPTQRTAQPSRRGRQSGEAEPSTAGHGTPRCVKCGGIHTYWHEHWSCYCCTECNFPSVADSSDRLRSTVPGGSDRLRSTVPVSNHNVPQQPVTARQQSVGRGMFDNIDLDGDEQSDGYGQDQDSSDSSSSSSSDSDNDDYGGGGGGGMPFGGPPSPPPSDNGGSQSTNATYNVDMSWSVDEDQCYKDKDLLSLKAPDIPHDAAGSRTFWNNIKTQMSSIDRSAEDHLTAWIDVAKQKLGDLRQVMYELDSNSQGCIRLDRYLAKLLLAKGESHPIFAVRFASYVESCQNANRSPKGRVLLCMVAQRFRLDRCRGRAISVIHLYNIELQGFKRSEVQHFVNRVRYVMSNLSPDDIKDRRMLFDWLFEKFKQWSPISDDVRKIRKAREDSKKENVGVSLAGHQLLLRAV